MTKASNTLADRVRDLRQEMDGFTPAMADALRLAEAFRDIEPETYSLPTTQTLGVFRPSTANVMLYGCRSSQTDC